MRQKDVYIVKSSTKYVLALKQCKINQLLLFRVNTDHFYTVDRNAQVSNNTRGLTYRLVCAMVTRTCHKVTLQVTCPSCYVLYFDMSVT